MDKWLSSHFPKIYGAITTSFTSYKEKHGQAKRTKKADFLFAVQKEISKKIKKLAGDDAFRLGVGQHLPIKLPPGNLKYCKVCDRKKGPNKKRAGRSTIECKECEIGLCPASCFLEWHTKKEVCDGGV